MTFGEFKKLEFSDDLPMEYALVSAVYKGEIDIICINDIINKALEVYPVHHTGKTIWGTDKEYDLNESLRDAYIKGLIDQRISKDD